MLQLLSMLDQWTEFLEKGGQVDAIYTDFEKAFDKVPHSMGGATIGAGGTYPPHLSRVGGSGGDKKICMCR